MCVSLVVHILKNTEKTQNVRRPHKIHKMLNQLDMYCKTAKRKQITKIKRHRSHCPITYACFYLAINLFMDEIVTLPIKIKSVVRAKKYSLQNNFLNQIFTYMT